MRLNKSCQNISRFISRFIPALRIFKKKRERESCRLVRGVNSTKKFYFVEKKENADKKNSEYLRGTGCRQAAPSKEVTNVSRTMQSE